MIFFSFLIHPFAKALWQCDVCLLNTPRVARPNSFAWKLRLRSAARQLGELVALQEGEVKGTVTNVRKLQNAQTPIYSALSAFPDPISCESGVYTYIRMHAKIQAAIRERKEMRRGRRKRRKRNKSDGRVSKSA